MGYYIQTGNNFGKALTIVREHGGRLIAAPKAYGDIPEGKALIVVVGNAAFEAAGFCFDESEFKVFTLPDDRRPKEYVLIDRLKAEELTDYQG